MSITVTKDGIVVIDDETGERRLVEDPTEILAEGWARGKAFREALRQSVDPAAILAKGGGFVHPGTSDGQWRYAATEPTTGTDRWIEAKDLLPLLEEDNDTWISDEVQKTWSNAEDFIECAKKAFPRSDRPPFNISQGEKPRFNRLGFFLPRSAVRVLVEVGVHSRKCLRHDFKFSFLRFSRPLFCTAVYENHCCCTYHNSG